MLHLSEINRDNWREATFVTSDPEQKCPLDEEWTTSSAFSIVQSVFEPEWESRVIMDDQRIIGFVFYGFWQEKQAPLFCRYIIDIAEQGKGYGQKALPVIVDEILSKYQSDVVYLTLDAGNKRAIHIYEKFGFMNTGEVYEGEMIYLYRKKPQ